MPFTIRTPNSSDELTILFESRAAVFFGEGILHQSKNSSLSDDVDLHPSTINLIAVTDEGQLIGGIRLALPTTSHTPANSNFFDFRPHLPTASAPASCGSMLWVDPTYRTSRAGKELVNMMCRISELDNVQHLCVSVRPRAEAFFLRMGFERVTETFMHPVEKVPVVPMIRPLTVADDDTIDLRPEVLEAQIILDGHRNRTKLTKDMRGNT